VSLFTFIMELDGGTYIKQVSAPNVVTAIWRWLGRAPASKFDKAIWKGIKKSFKEEQDLWRAELTVRIRRTKNVWCATAYTKVRRKTYLALINIVKTSL
jgi:hypothetical protein